MSLVAEERNTPLHFPVETTARLHSGRAAPWLAAGLISAALFVAENYYPSEVIDGASVDLQVTKLQGNIVRELAYTLIAVIGVVWLIRARGYVVRWRNPVVFALGSLLAWCMLSIVWAQEPGTSLKRFVAYLLMMTGAAGMVAAWSRVAVLQFISLSAAAHLTIGVLAEIAIGHFTPWASDYRFAGTLHWNEQGFCCLVLALSSLAAGDADPRHRKLFRLLVVYGLTFLVLTKSRSSFLGAAIGLIVYLVLTRSFRAKVGIVLSTLVTSLLLYMSGASDWVIQVLSRNGEGVESLTGRQPLWEEAMTFVMVRPVQGYGYENFWTTTNVDYFSEEFHWTISAAHNGYMEALLTIGFIGMFLHTATLLTGMGRGSVMVKKTQSPIFALAVTLCLLYLVVATLEAVLLVKISPSSFYLALLLCTLCLEKSYNSQTETGLLY